MAMRRRSATGVGDKQGAQRRSWELAAERGPDWLFVRFESVVGEGAEKVDLAEAIWDMIREHHANRVVLELDRVDAIDEPLIGAIAEIGSRVRHEGGLIRACGLSQTDCERLEKASASGVPHFASRCEAVSPRGWCVGSCE